MKIVKRIILYILCIVLTLSLVFYAAVGIGFSKTLQTVWVTTAMTTMNHKWLATAIIPEKTINKIMRENLVDDRGLESELTSFEKEEKLEQTQSLKKEGRIRYYANQGYVYKEDGLYIKDISGTGWKGYLMLVEDPARVSLADTKNQFVEGQSVKRMVEENGGKAGLNAGGFNDGPNYDSNGGSPYGFVIKEGNLIAPVDIEDKAEYNLIGLNDEGVLLLKQCNASDAINKYNIVSGTTFSPFLIVNGEGTIKSGTGGWGLGPRSAIGQRKTGEIIFLAIDGRMATSIGVDIDVVQNTLLAEDCENASLLDGGSSTVMVYNNEFVNKPALGHERFINNCWVVK